MSKCVEVSSKDCRNPPLRSRKAGGTHPTAMLHC